MVGIRWTAAAAAAVFGLELLSWWWFAAVNEQMFAALGIDVDGMLRSAAGGWEDCVVVLSSCWGWEGDRFAPERAVCGPVCGSRRWRSCWAADG